MSQDEHEPLARFDININSMATMKPSGSRSLASFNSPPPVDESQSWLAEDSEREPYGIDGKSQNADPVSDSIAVEEKEGATAEDQVSTNSKSANEVVDNIQQTITDRTDTDVILPSKLGHLIDQFLNDLQEPKYVSPLTAEDISNMFQEFYASFQTKAQEYVYGSVVRPPREVQLQTYKEMTEKRKERAQRPARVKKLVEAAEARACAAVYTKIFAMTFGDDRRKSEFVQTKARLLKQIGITAADLDLVLNDEDKFQPKLNEAGEALRDMDKAETPRQKLHHLVAAHRVIVSVLTEAEGEQTSADFILPALLYTFIYHDIPNMLLNVKYIQRFRNKHYLDGESMYCLTNFEAAVVFLETVTLKSLNVDVSTIPPDFDFTPLLIPAPDGDPLRSGNRSNRSSRSNSLQEPVVAVGRPRSSSATLLERSRRLSVMHATDLANNAVNSADHSIKTISSTLGNSYRFLLTKFTESQPGSAKKDGDKYPHTLADARKVVGLEPPTSPGRPTTCTDSTADITPSSSHTDLGAIAVDSDHSKEKSVSSQRSGDSMAAATAPSPGTLFGKLPINVMRGFRSPSVSFGKVDESNGTPSLKPIEKIHGPIDRIVNCSEADLKVSDVKDLHNDYKRLVKYLKSINAFE